MVRSYHQSAATLNLLRAFTKGGYADLNRVHQWNLEYVATSREGRRYEAVAQEIERALRFMAACGIDLAAEIQLHQVDFFKLVLPYIGDEKAPGAAVERKAPGVAKTISPDFRQTTSAHERIVSWNGILQTTIHVVYVDPEHFAQHGLLILRIAQRIATTAAVTQSDVKETIWAKGELSPFVIGKWLIDCK